MPIYADVTSRNARWARSTVRRDLDLLHELAAQRRAVDERTRVTVGALRVAGTSWTVIAEQLGVTRSAAQKRYGGDVLV